ncbi:MAG: HAD-IIIC family phosphatase [Massilia sp.]|uniref:HAD-IIIC family phosphatase n=1 Tax=Massilia sp. TaxID=1882437 RepID=UPI002FCA7F44
MSNPELTWLPHQPDWNECLQRVTALDKASAWSALVELANVRLDMMATTKLDRQLLKLFKQCPVNLETKPVRLAVLGSSTVDHLHAGIRVGTLRRNIWVSLYQGNYGQYVQDIHDDGSDLHAWAPNTVLFAFDARHLLAGYQVGESSEASEVRVAAAIDHIVGLWRSARSKFGCDIIQQTILPIHPRLFGENENRLPGSPAALVARLNEQLRKCALDEGATLLALDHWAAEDGLTAWHDPAMWHRAKQEVHLAAMPMYGDIVGRILAAQQGKSRKCMVLDLDNTLWGGVIGDDGIDGIVLGQGNALGEAFSEFQRYAKDLSRRGVILAVCSKNDEKNALLPFEQHPEMILRRDDIACFSASWGDKATAIRAIARQLNIGLDAIVFADDNPFERNIVRRELPMVAVPELPEDPAFYTATIARAGYFEGIAMTAEDAMRTQQYKANIERESERHSATDLPSYLKSLDMTLHWSRFTYSDQARVVQLINKTNQFNLTTRRYSADEVGKLLENPAALPLQMRLVDKFGDNGIISIIIGYLKDKTIDLDTWLMSCRVLGRQVEHAVLGIVVNEARRMGANRLTGHFRPTEKNSMVAEHYLRLGFTALPDESGINQQFELHLDAYQALPTFFVITEN